MHPYLDIPYRPRLSHFLGGFDIYDREESLGEALAAYDPEDPSDRSVLISTYVIKRFSKLSHRHKFVLFAVLGEALEKSDDVFQEVLEHDPYSHTLLPDGWDQMSDPKAVFESMYFQLSEAWVDELYKASQEDSSTW